MAITSSSTESDSPSSVLEVESGFDASSPLYMHPSENPDAMLVLVPFSGLGYRSWRGSVMRALSVKNKLGFINGKCKQPDPEKEPSKFRLCERCDDMVTSWILNSLDKEIADIVEYANDAVELWKELEDRYDLTNKTKLYQIQKEINDISQGVLDITGYYTKMKKLWEKLSTLSAKTQCTCQCTCGAKENMHKAEQDRRLIKFLMGLNKVYTTVRGSILMLNPLPSMTQAFSLLVQEEKQMEVKPNNHVMMDLSSLYISAPRSNIRNGQQYVDSASFNVDTSRNNNFRTNYSPCNYPPNITRPRPFCDYCKCSGHTKDKCYKLHGYPPGFNSNLKFNRGKRTVANVHGAPETNSDKHEEVESLEGNRNSNVNLTKEQYGQLVSLLQHFHSGNGKETSSIPNGAMNFAGPFNEETSGDW
uniref:Retrotransposon Copia-like N-terminal domain-containing protein n=1 Tax=Nicotiana tabacum TaxID=4097 RepID=A0A1S4BUF4_TOBAC|nr:PREDICTED: uncharacterized protein LOC107812013 [Nicotiana tabacum]